MSHLPGCQWAPYSNTPLNYFTAGCTSLPPARQPASYAILPLFWRSCHQSQPIFLMRLWGGSHRMCHNVGTWLAMSGRVAIVAACNCCLSEVSNMLDSWRRKHALNY